MLHEYLLHYNCILFLAIKSYFGHVFWDQETWMYPPLLLLHSNFGHMLLKTRARTMACAALNANQTGYHGLRFPWESALTGNV